MLASRVVAVTLGTVTGASQHIAGRGRLYSIGSGAALILEISRDKSRRVEASGAKLEKSIYSRNETCRALEDSRRKVSKGKLGQLCREKSNENSKKTTKIEISRDKCREVGISIDQRRNVELYTEE